MTRYYHMRICPICGEEFHYSSSSPRVRKYCGKPCRVEARRLAKERLHPTTSSPDSSETFSPSKRLQPRLIPLPLSAIDLDTQTN